MPSAKPTQVIVHRIELQTSERKYLEEYMAQRRISTWAAPLASAAGPIGIGLGLATAGWLVIKGWAAVQQALIGPLEDAQDAIGDAFAPRKDTGSGERNTANKVRDWTVLDLSDILQLFPEDSRANQAGDVLERGSDYIFDTILGLGSSK